MKKKEKFICKCGNEVRDMCYCPKCKQTNFGKRKIVVVNTGEVIETDKKDPPTITDKTLRLTKRV